MSAQVAVLTGRRTARQQRAATIPRERPAIRVAAFAALGLYGALSWARLMDPHPTGRLLALLALAVAIAAGGLVLRQRSWAMLVAGSAISSLATLALAGVPLGWILHLRVAVTADAIGEGLSTLPRILVPYNGINEWVRLVTVLGAGVLLTAPALLLAFAPRPLSDLVRAAAALPLIVLAMLPATLAAPRLAYLQGLLLFCLLAAFMWAERVPPGDIRMVVLICGVAGAIGMALAPTLEQHKPWVNYQALAGDLASGHVDSFDWSQRYGPIAWPRVQREVLDVQAAHPDYWKAENLDLFDGRGWVAGNLPSADQMAAVRSGPIARFTQTLRVTIRSMKSSDVIAAGMAAAPLDISGPVVAGPSQGTWTLGGELGPGDSYVVRVYAPHPSLVELADAGTDYPATLLPSYLSLTLPPRAQHGVSSAPQQVIFAPFGSSRTAAYGATSVDPAPAVEHSPYARELALARRLAQGARTPYAYVARVQRYLASGFTYNETPTTGRYPLDTFLFDAKSGYCQQFAGAMALLLRMGGVPARVSAGFTSGQYRAATRSWAVSDLDAHAWVEAWFPGYGWVRFDPTPAAAPARGGHLPLPAIESSGAAPPPATDARRPDLSAGANSRGVVKAKHHGSNLELILACAAALVLLLAAGLVVLAHRRRPRTGEELVSELVRAFARSGRPIEDGVTLTRLEHRLRGAPDAAAYVRALRLSRFGDSLELPTARQRRALRQQLRAGLGVGAGVRALWALPPRWTRERAP